MIHVWITYQGYLSKMKREEGLMQTCYEKTSI